MKKWLLCLAGVLLCLAGGCKDSESTSYEKGIESLEDQNYTEAVEYFQEAIQKGDHAVKAWRGTGISWTGQGAFDKAEEAFETALELSENSKKAFRADLYLYLADARYHQGDYNGCIEACEELLKLRKEKDAYFLRGSAYLQKGDRKKADANFGKVIAGSREYEDYIDIYKVHKACDLNADGAGYLETALEITPKSPEDYYNRGRVYFYLDDYETALKELKKALDKDYMQAAAYMGKVYAAAGDMENAGKMYKKCLDTKELKAEACNGLAYCALSEEDYDSALSYIEKGLKENDEEVSQALLFNEIAVYERMQDFTAAREKMAVYLEKYPADETAIRENYFLETR